MRHTLICFIALLLVAGRALAEEPAVPAAASVDGAVKAEETKSPEKEGKKEEKKEGKKSEDQKGAKSETAEKGDKVLSGMSIVGNDEAPKSLVIVPWKSSELGQSLDISKDVDAGRRPVDKDVFMRELAYYRIRSESAEAGDSGSSSGSK